MLNGSLVSSAICARGVEWRRAVFMDSNVKVVIMPTLGPAAGA